MLFTVGHGTLEASERTDLLLGAEGFEALDELIADAAVRLRNAEVRHLFHGGHLQAHAPTPSGRVDPRGILVYDLGATQRGQG